MNAPTILEALKAYKKADKAVTKFFHDQTYDPCGDQEKRLTEERDQTAKAFEDAIVELVIAKTQSTLSGDLVFRPTGG